MAAADHWWRRHWRAVVGSVAFFSSPFWGALRKAAECLYSGIDFYGNAGTAYDIYRNYLVPWLPGWHLTMPFGWPHWLPPWLVTMVAGVTLVLWDFRRTRRAVAVPQSSIRFGAPRQTEPEHFVREWSVPVSSSVRLEGCSILLLLQGRSLALRWPTWNGPVEQWTLRPGQAEILVPVVIRSHLRARTPATRDVTLEPGVARIMDASFLIRDEAHCTDLEPGLHEVRLRVECRRGGWTSPPYRIAIPIACGNTNFEVHQLADGDPLQEPPDEVKRVGIEAQWRALYETQHGESALGSADVPNAPQARPSPQVPFDQPRQRDERGPLRPVRQDPMERIRQQREKWAEQAVRDARLHAIRSLVALRDAGHAMLNVLQRPAQPDSVYRSQQAVQWYRNEVVELAGKVSPGKAAVLDSAYLRDDDGREVRNAHPGTAPTNRHHLRLYLAGLLRQLETFLNEV